MTSASSSVTSVDLAISKNYSDVDGGLQACRSRGLTATKPDPAILPQTMSQENDAAVYHDFSASYEEFIDVDVDRVIARAQALDAAGLEE